MTDDWTEPHSWDGERSDHDRSEERWLQPWEEGDRGWPEECAGPRYWLAFDGSLGFCAPGDIRWQTIDFFSPRARFVSDR